METAFSLRLNAWQMIALETLVESYLGQTASTEFLASHGIPVRAGDDSMPDMHQESLAGVLEKLQAANKEQA